MSLNVATITGRLTTAPELKRTPLGDLYTTFTVAVDEGKDKTSFIPCVAFGKTAELICKNDKGSLIGISGRLLQKTFTKQDGTKGSVLQIIVSEFSFLEKKKEQTEFPLPEEPKPTTDTNLDNIPEDELPF